ncbi:MAG: hypothetical protein R2862_05045 [Thermoanaerobaculia bacterium]
MSSNSKVMVPKDNLDLVGLRPLCERREIRTLFNILENGSVDAQPTGRAATSRTWRR